MIDKSFQLLGSRWRINPTAILLVYLLLIACSGLSPQKTPANDLTVSALKNAEYQSQYIASGKVKLTNGEYRQRVVEGFAAEVVVTLTDATAIGKLKDCRKAAAVILKTQTGGSGTFTELAVVVNDNGTPQNLATKFLGDRVKVKNISFEAGTITVDLITHGPSDPMCCPTLDVTQKYELQDNALIQVAGVESFRAVAYGAFNQRLSEAAAKGESWVHDPVRIGLEFLGSRGSPRVDIRRQDQNGEAARLTTVTIVEDGYLDDSVRGTWTWFKMTRLDDNTWRLVDVRRAFRCWRGHHQDSYSAQLCP